jgi:hypothetical protein
MVGHMELLLRYEGEQSIGHPLFARYAQVTRGTPGRCPACGAFGFIAALDVRRALQTQACRHCGYRWEYHFDDDGRILEVHGSGPIPDRDPEPPETADPVVDVPAAPVSPEAPKRIVVRRRNRPLRATRTGKSS